MSDLRILFRSFVKELPIIRSLRYKNFRKNHGNQKMAEKVYAVYAPQFPEVAQMDREDVLKDMIRMQTQYRFGYDEYFLYRFFNKSDAERLEFIADYDRIGVVESLNRATNQPLFDDKARTYRKYGKYYRRELLAVGNGQSDFQKLKDFWQKHERIIIKPADSSCGNGVKILDISKAENADAIVKDTLEQNTRGLIAEELIRQAGEMAKLHPQSVNTLRITTLRMNDRVEVLHPFLKIGRGDSVVDNGGAGGILCTINADGVVDYTGDELGRSFDVHPETGEQIVGFCIPRWNEVIEMVKELALVTPTNRYTGWDVALSKDGWVLVEANARGQFVGWQIPSQKGFRREICSLLMEISEKKHGKLVTRLMGELEHE